MTKPCIIQSNKTVYIVTKIISRPHLTIFILEGIFAYVKFTETVLLARTPTSQAASSQARCYCKSIQSSTEKIHKWERSMKSFPLHLLLGWPAVALVGLRRFRPAKNDFIYGVPSSMPHFEGSMYYFSFTHIESFYMCRSWSKQGYQVV